jgi:hypothetical protein
MEVNIPLVNYGRNNQNDENMFRIMQDWKSLFQL